MALNTPPEPGHHTLIEDVQAYFAGTLLVALGVAMLSQGKLITGGAVGLAILVHYISGLGFGKLFFALNVPFILLAWWKMGWVFTLRSFCAVTLLSLLSELMPELVAFERVQPVYAAITGGLLMGVGMLILFRHGTSLGGFNVLALYVQKRYGLSAGGVQLVLDGAIILASLAMIPLPLIAISLLGAVALNLTLAINHKPGRYISY
jgi:uncharacterized membrane-anchored protein YitT (DUF2179 family)